MMPTKSENALLEKVDGTLLSAVITGAQSGLSMAGVKPPPVGASCFFDARRPISVIVGVVGDNNGSVTVNLSEKAMLWLASKMLMEEQKEHTEESVDAIMEIGNLIAGGIKEELTGTVFESQGISVPSLIMGANYSVTCTRGMNTVSVTFELEEMPLANMADRFFTCTISLMKRVA